MKSISNILTTRNIREENNKFYFTMFVDTKRKRQCHSNDSTFKFKSEYKQSTMLTHKETKAKQDASGET